jgi:TetR/AcrR family transcriptional regulator, regulator of cefoperazone and chloramphenicol sensitivity
MSSLEIKRKIIEATKDLLKKNASVTIKDIADACYVNIAAVNYHFGSKEQLLLIVIEEVLNELKIFVLEDVMKMAKQVKIEILLESITTYIYNFSIDNIGVLNYLFLTKDLQFESSNVLIDTFLKDNEFTKVIYENLSKNLDIKNPKELFAKYLILFSSFSIPLFIQISQSKTSKNLQIDTFKDPEFRQYFISNLIKMVQEK